MFIVGFGAVLFGLIVGWIAYRIVRNRSGATAWVQDLIALLGIVAGAAALSLFHSDVIFGWYALGLVIGFFGYLALGIVWYGKQELQPWQLEPLSSTPKPEILEPLPSTPTPTSEV